jgi:acetyl-CoA C-acetyltransferase
MGIGPVPATARVHGRRAGLELKNLDLIELNEAFAAQALSVLQEWGVAADDPRLNPHGSGISLGHPVGATGARMLVTLCHELRRRGGDGSASLRGLATMCIGGGQGLAAVLEAE